MRQKLHNKSDDEALEKRLYDILELLYSFYDQEIDMSLERVERFLTQIGSPHLHLPPVIHVAGTNGKGSTIACLRSLLEASDKRVHVMTSPHLVHPTERIRLAGEPITTHALIEVLEECLAVNRSEPITFFEMLTAASFLAMSRTPADYVILETGMGGRLDATNVVPNPICTIITTISKDHETFLGRTLDQIASEKAGIMKAGVPCIISYQTDATQEAQVQKVFHDISTDLSPVSKLYRYGADWDIAPSTHSPNDRLNFTWHSESFEVSRPNLLGLHQVYNAGAALAAYRIIMESDETSEFDASVLSPKNKNNPLLTIYWPGRLQRLTDEPICKMTQVGQEIWCDGGHNDSAGEFLAKQARVWQEQDDKPLHLIIAMVDRKNPRDFLAPLIPYTNSLTCSEIKEEPNSYTAEELYNLCEPLGFQEIEQNEDLEGAVKNIQDPNARILITGSLYLLGTILR